MPPATKARPVADAGAVAPRGTTVASTPLHEESWTVAIVAEDALSAKVAVATGADGVALVYGVAGVPHVDRLRRGRAGWSPERLVAGTSAGATFGVGGPGDPSWALFGDAVAGSPDAYALQALRLTAGSRPEQVLPGGERAFAVAVAPGGVPHACVSTSAHPTLAYATRSADRWSTTDLGNMPGTVECAIAVGDERLLAVTSTSRAPNADCSVDIAVRGPDLLWKTSSLATGVRRGAVDVAIRGKEIVVALSDNRRIKLARRPPDGTWTQTTLVPDAGGLVGILTVSLDTAGRASVAYVFERASKDNEVAVAREGGAPPSTVVTGVSSSPSALTLALDAKDRPHVAWAGVGGHVFYATLATKGDAAVGLAIDPKGLIGVCAELVGWQLGEPGTRSDGGAECGHLESKGITRTMLEQRCGADDSDACLLGGAVAVTGRKIGPLEIDVRSAPCDGAKRCRIYRMNQLELVRMSDEPRNDEPAAKRLFERACLSGRGGGCLARAELASDSKEAAPFQLTACRGGIVAACTVLATRALKQEVQIGAEDAGRIRTTLDDVCFRAKSATACNGSAFVNEEGFGGPASAAKALAAHVVACGAGSVASCTRVLLGTGTRPKPPANLTGDILKQTLSAACNGTSYEDACLALANAYQSGWALPRDPRAARDVLDGACNDGGASACLRLGRARHR